ncbi:T9SS type A sorting domain-containing protein [Pedobacter sp. SD-b]|uniref:T9SS type A sorting domain-containing protein n=1 Tax=Pedobacter segetis TaxID=2793069 RepID=A0ABS1BNZ9_9SPHI|nr:T9SS type A sorting domain-containing protein [Pedobacter segetis]MBK0384071.1 T9SS type A sorting domain-containing protein [Pedobacter segetis]
MNRNFYFILFLALFLSSASFAQKSITINAQTYKHIFEGSGCSFGNSEGDYAGMSEANQALADQMLSNELKLDFIQTYMNQDPSNPANAGTYAKRIKFMKAAKAINPDNQIAMVFQAYPGYLCIGGTNNGDLDYTRTGIYDEVADWYFNTLKFFKDSGVVVDIADVSNEPDLNRQNKYGYGDPKKGLAILVQEVIPRLKAKLNDPLINTTNIKVPLIMGPSTLSVTQCRSYVNYFKNNYPSAWNQLDIVSTHQYAGGLNNGAFGDIIAALDGKKLYQNEQHGYHNDNLGLDNYAGLGDQIKTVLDMSALMNVAINSGVQAWYYYQTNNSANFAASSLIRTPTNGNAPSPYKQFNAFKQITNTQPKNSNVLDYTSANITNSIRQILAFRKQGSDKVYLNLSNFTDVAEQITITLKKSDNTDYPIKSLTTVTTSVTQTEGTTNETFTPNVTSYTITTEPFSVNTLTFTVDDPSLPVELISFNVNKTSTNTVELNWNTSSESNNDYFTISHSTDGKTFQLLDKIKTKGNGSKPNHYRFVHNNPNIGNNYYQLHQVDLDGTSKDLGIRAVNLSLNKQSSFVAYPVPAKDFVTVNFNGNLYRSITVSDVTGKVVYSQNIASNATKVSINLSAYQKGLYFLRGLTDSSIDVIKILKE